jgi:tripartite ATP-independent transporter DctM subunit
VILADILPLLMFLVLGTLLFSGYPVAFVLGGVAVLFGAIGMAFGQFLPIQFFAIVTRIWGGAAENVLLTAVPMFIIMGTVLERSGIAEDLLKTLQMLLGRIPGGLALSVSVLGTILAATTGIIGASVIMLTLMALPTMLKRGYSPEFATGTVASAGTLGILIPPSIMLVLMSDLLAISTGNLFVGALLPGLLLASLYFIYIMGFSFLRPQDAPPFIREDTSESRLALAVMAMRSLLPPVFLIVLVLGSIFAGWATPTEAAGVGAGGAFAIALFRRRLSLKTMQNVLERSAETIAMVFLIFIGATAFTFVFRILGGEHIVLEILDSTGAGPWGILLLVMAVVFLLGFFFDWLEIILIVVPIFAPVMKTLDFGDHVASSELLYWMALLLAINLQTSFLTPPFGLALFYMKGVAPPSIKIQHLYRGIIPFVCLQLVGLALVIAFPEIALWLPRQLLN